MTIYIVRRHDGTYRAHGNGSYWTPDMQKARVYPKPGPPKGLITSWKRSSPEEPTPQMLTLTFSEADMQVVDMTETTAKKLSAIQRRKVERAEAHAKWEIEELTRKHVEIKQRLAALQG